MRSFLGFCSYYRKYIEGFANIAKPLHNLTEKTAKFIWTDACETSFNTLKTYLTSAPIITHPDFTKPFILDTDASGTAIGAVLSQMQDDNERVIAYTSRSLTKSERQYCWLLYISRNILDTIFMEKSLLYAQTIFLSAGCLTSRTQKGRWQDDWKYCRHMTWKSNIDLVENMETQILLVVYLVDSVIIVITKIANLIKLYIASMYPLLHQMRKTTLL